MLLNTAPPAFRFTPGRRPLLISMPHVGTYVPPALLERFTPEARQLHDTDWHLERLYEFAHDLGASVLVATHSRYVIDLNRPPNNAKLYPGQDNTGLCPTDTFNKTPLYAAGDVPLEAEIGARRDAYWQPYHQQLQRELKRLKAAHATVLLWDAHSIRSVVPRFFEGQLPDLNLGTANNTSCAPALASALLGIGEAASASGYRAVLNGRFKGGHITRQYGSPAQGVHAVQLELSQCSYMQETMPFNYLPAQAAKVQPTLQALLKAGLAWVQSSGR